MDIYYLNNELYEFLKNKELYDIYMNFEKQENIYFSTRQRYTLTTAR